MSRFYKIFFSAIAVFLALLVIGSVVLVNALAEYESTLPQKIAETFFKEQIESRFFMNVGGTEFESRADVVEAFIEKYGDKEMSLLAAASTEENTFRYVVKSGEERLLSFDVIPSGNKSGFGFKLYETVNVKFLFGEEIILRAPADCTVFVNGVAVSEDYRSEEEKADMDLPDGITAVPVFTYKIKLLCSNPEVTAKDAKGEKREVEYNEKSGEYEIGYGYSEQLLEQHGTLALNAARAYATRMQNDCGFGEVAKFFQKGTDTYEFIRTSEVVWVWAHEGYGFSDEWCGEFRELSENVFTCRVKMTQTLYLTNNQPYKDYIDVTLCFNKQPNGNYLVYSLKGN